MKSPLSHDIPHNVHGWERAASIAGGLLFLGKGLRRGGIGGLVQMALGGAALTRGMTGRCEAKRIYDEYRSHSGEVSATGSSEPMTGADTSVMPSAFGEPGTRQPTSALGVGDTSPLGGNTDTATTADNLPGVAPTHPQPDVTSTRPHLDPDGTPR